MSPRSAFTALLTCILISFFERASSAAKLVVSVTPFSKESNAACWKASNSSLSIASPCSSNLVLPAGGGGGGGGGGVSTSVDFSRLNEDPFSSSMGVLFGVSSSLLRLDESSGELPRESSFVLVPSNASGISSSPALVLVLPEASGSPGGVVLPPAADFFFSRFFFFSHAFSSVSWTCFFTSLTCFSEILVGSETRSRL